MRHKFRMIGALLFLLGSAHAGPYAEMYKRLATEMRVSETKQKDFTTWIQKEAELCRQNPEFNVEKRISCLKRAVFTDGMVQFDTLTFRAPQDLLPDRLIVTGKGSCVSISFLTLLLAEKMDIRAEPVSLPGHVYIRFSNGVNWESNRQGYAYTDAEYREKYQLDPGKGRISRAMDVQAFEGLFRFEWANRLWQQNQGAAAIPVYLKAESFSNDFRIPGNRAVVLESLGKRAEAKKIMDSLWLFGARSEELVWNRALLMIRANEDFQDVLFMLEDAEGRRVESARLKDLKRRVLTEMSK